MGKIIFHIVSLYLLKRPVFLCHLRGGVRGCFLDILVRVDRPTVPSDKTQPRPHFITPRGASIDRLPCDQQRV